MCTQCAVLQYQLPPVQSTADHLDQLLRVCRFLNEVVGSGAHGLKCHGDIAMAGDQNHRNVAVNAVDCFKHGEAIHARHAHIGNHDARPVDGEPLKTLFST